MEIYFFLVYALAYLSLFVVCFYVISMLTYSKKNLPLEAEDKTISIVIPAYNEEKCIEETINSALAIDYPPEKTEIIVIDDGSKDNTFKLAKKFEKNSKFKVRVFTKSNGGKGSALNLGIEKAKGEIIFTMDADTIVEPFAVKRMIARFYNKEVAAVTPSMGVFEPKSIWQKIQHVEYYLSTFIRKSLSTTNSIYITPGAFSAYRKSFFEENGGYEIGNITEDFEIALRIQSKDYIIENAVNAVMYTHSPKSFKELLVQRRRWYSGMVKNLWNYKREMFGAKRGILSLIVMPMVIISLVLSLALAGYAVIKGLINLQNNFSLAKAVNFQFNGFLDFDLYFLNNFFDNLFYSLFSNNTFIITLLFVAITMFYLYFAKKKIKYIESTKLSLLLFLITYSFLFAFWWIVSFFYLIMNKKIIWRAEKDGKQS